MEKQEYVAALRELANYIEERSFPDKWRGWYCEDSFIAPEVVFYVANKKHFGEIISSIGSGKKSGDNISTDMVKKLPLGAEIKVCGKKESICELVIVGTKTVPAKESVVIPATPEHEEEIYDWKCPDSFIALKDEGGN